MAVIAWLYLDASPLSPLTHKPEYEKTGDVLGGLQGHSLKERMVKLFDHASFCFMLCMQFAEFRCDRDGGGWSEEL